MKIGIIGGGNLGCVLATKFSQENEVCLYLSPVEKDKHYNPHMRILTDSGDYIEANIKVITADLEELCSFAEYIFVTFPAFLFKGLAKDLIPHLRKGTHLVFVPGCGGSELAFKDVLSKGVTITGLQRVHAIARIIEQGELTRESGVKKDLRIASIPQSFNKEAVETLSKLYKMIVLPLDNYLNVTFVNSNPILHTSRLYSIFKDYVPNEKEYDSLPLFYEDWTLETSNLLINMDLELFKIMDVFEKNGLPVKQILSLLDHYECKDAEGLTKKIKSIDAFKGLTTPSKQLENKKYIPDLNSRYFTADFPYGLDVLLSFAEHLKVDCPNMKMVSDWYHRITNTKKVFDIKDYSITSKEQLFALYK